MRSLSYATAWNMIYTSYDFYPYGNDATSQESDAAYIRMVDK